MKNCVLITAYSNCDEAGPFKAIERWDQLITHTIPSVKECIPNSELFLIDGTLLNYNQKTTLKELKVTLFHEGDYIGVKNPGELNMVRRFVNSFSEFNYNSFSKITGRYNVTFTQEFFNNNEFIFKRRESWMSYALQLIETFFYKFPGNYFNEFKEKINNLQIVQDLEHSFEREGIFKGLKSVEKLFITERCGADGNTYFK